MSDQLSYASAHHLLAKFRDKSLSPVEATEAVLARIEASNGRINAFCLVDGEAALAAARGSEARWAAGQPAGLIDGVPTTIKDLNLTKGWPTLRGSTTVAAGQRWQEDAPVVARLREHGAVLVGKTTTPEFGWKGVTDSPLTGITRNPWDLTRTPGGSSGGAAAACAAGMGALHVGSDGGGSIRIPSGFSGIFGLKPSFGRVPVFPASPFGTISHIGPITRTVADAALMLRVMAEPDWRDWFALPYDRCDYLAGLQDGVKGLRIAFSPALGYATVEPEVAEIVAQAAAAFEALGANVEAVDPGFADPTPMFNTIWKVGAFNGLKGLSDEQRSRMDPGLQRVYAEGAEMPLESYLDAVNARTALGAHMREFHERHDLLLTPALAVAAFEAGRLTPEGYAVPPDEPNAWVYWTPFTYPFNLTQQPACSVPCGFTAAGLPVGLQIVGPMHNEALVLRAARAYEAAHPTGDRRPPL